MSSMPMQQPRRQPNRSNTEEQAAQLVRRHPSASPSTTSLDSQTVYLNDSETVAASATSPKVTQQNSTSPPRPRPDEEGRRCWICFSDEADDAPESSPWRSPCPCALTAHEACLLDWIADLESPDSTRSTVKPAKIECPQCKTPIHVARAHSYVVDAFSAFESFAGKMLLPGVMAGLSYTFILAASHHGAHSVRMVFGTQDADLILAPLRRWTVLEQSALRYFPTLATPILRGWRGLRVELGLPLIPGALILSRTSFGDAILPILPIIFFATHPQASQTLTIGYWPPSAALTFVLLPYMRSAYDEAMERLWGERERNWMKEIKPPQASETTDEDDGHDAEEVDEVIQFELNVPFLDEFVEERPPPPPPARAVTPPPVQVPTAHAAQQDNAAQLDAEIEAELEALANAARDTRQAIEAAEARLDAQAEAPQPVPAQPAGGAARERGVEIFTLASRAGTSVVGALLFPTISAASGELLRLLLPLAWTATQRGSKGRVLPPTGLLQTRWGRSVVGGCLFVVLKDAVKIYCRWRMAVSFRERRVREYDKKNKKLLD